MEEDYFERFFETFERTMYECSEVRSVEDPDISFGGTTKVERRRREDRGAEGVFWSILMSKCASHVYTCIAYFHFHQYKPTSYNYMLE